MSYYVYLPPDYNGGARHYPVLYMLHGAGGDKDEWAAYGLVNDVDQLISSGSIQPLIVVMPQGDVGYWVNWANDGPRWGDYVAQDLRCHVDASYRTVPDGGHRAIGGLSMGGSGGAAACLQPPGPLPDRRRAQPVATPGRRHLLAHLRHRDDFAEREPIDLAANAPGIESLQVWFDAGQDDPWLPRDELIHQNLLDRGIAHGWDVLPGGHDGDYWTQQPAAVSALLRPHAQRNHEPKRAAGARRGVVRRPVPSTSDDPVPALPDAEDVLATPDHALLTLPDLDSPLLSAPDAALATPDEGPDLDPADLPADLLPADDPDWTPDGGDGGAGGPAILLIGPAGASAS